LVLIGASIVGVRFLLFSQFYSSDVLSLSEVLRITIYAISIILIFLFLFQMRSLIGGRTLTNLLLGRYHRARKEDRIFMFLDVQDSTRIAASLGDSRFHDYLATFFFDTDELVANNGGEILSYVGDAMIATWPVRDADQNASVLEALRQITAYVRDNQRDYKAEFGVPIDFRAAIHSGPVIAGEYGGTKRQITYLGDTVNATARLEQLSKSLHAKIISSQLLLGQIRVPQDVSVKHVGEFNLKGIKSPMSVCTVEFVESALTQDARE
jgi:adenylate cyclase